MALGEERETGSALAPPRSSRQSVHRSSSILSPHSSSSPLSFSSSVDSISEGAGAARREQVAAFKVVKTTESRKKRVGRGKHKCV